MAAGIAEAGTERGRYRQTGHSNIDRKHPGL